MLSHAEIFDDLQKYKIELPNEISKTPTTDTTECLAGTYRKLSVD